MAKHLEAAGQPGSAQARRDSGGRDAREAVARERARGGRRRRRIVQLVRAREPQPRLCQQGADTGLGRIAWSIFKSGLNALLLT
jgi:hypothetical protein